MNNRNTKEGTSNITTAKEIKIRGLLSILFLFGNEFNKSNKTGARMLDSIYLDI